DVPGFQGLAKPASTVYGPPRHLACRHGHCREAWRHVGHKPFERGGSYRRPNHPRNNRGLCGVTGVPIGVGVPFLKPPLHWPAPFVGAIDPVETRARRREVGPQGAALLRPAVPAAEQPETSGTL